MLLGSRTLLCACLTFPSWMHGCLPFYFPALAERLLLVYPALMFFAATLLLFLDGPHASANTGNGKTEKTPGEAALLYAAIKEDDRFLHGIEKCSRKGTLFDLYFTTML